MTQLGAVVGTIISIGSESPKGPAAHFSARVRGLPPVELGVADLLAETSVFGGELVGQPLATGTAPFSLVCGKNTFQFPCIDEMDIRLTINGLSRPLLDAVDVEDLEAAVLLVGVPVAVPDGILRPDRVETDEALRVATGKLSDQLLPEVEVLRDGLLARVPLTAVGSVLV